MNYNNMTLEELLNILPDNLHVARNDNADENNRWKIFNRVLNKYVGGGFPSARELIIGTLTKIDGQSKTIMGNVNITFAVNSET